MISTLVIRGFKTFVDAKIDLGRLNVFIGANGAGKSNVLEALGVLGTAVSGSVNDETLINRGVRLGVPRLYKSSFKGKSRGNFIRFEATYIDEGEENSEIRYSASLENPNEKPKPNWGYRHERLMLNGKRVFSRGPNKEKDKLPEFLPEKKRETGVWGLLAKYKQDPSVDNAFWDLHEFGIYSPITNVMRGLISSSQSISSKAPIGLYGEGMPEAIGDLVGHLTPEEKGSHRFWDYLLLTEWVNLVNWGGRSKDFLSPSISTANRIIRFGDKYMPENRNVISAYDASEGALYLLFLALLVLHPETPRIFAIDNFDKAMHPAMARKAISLVAADVKRLNKQVLLTTHNPWVLDGLDLTDPEIRLFAIGRSLRGHTKVDRIPVELVQEKGSKEGLTLSELWVRGALGALPRGYE